MVRVVGADTVLDGLLLAPGTEVSHAAVVFASAVHTCPCGYVARIGKTVGVAVLANIEDPIAVAIGLRLAFVRDAIVVAIYAGTNAQVAGVIDPVLVTIVNRIALVWYQVSIGVEAEPTRNVASIGGPVAVAVWFAVVGYAVAITIRDPPARSSARGGAFRMVTVQVAVYNPRRTGRRYHSRCNRL